MSAAPSRSALNLALSGDWVLWSWFSISCVLLIIFSLLRLRQYTLSAWPKAIFFTVTFIAAVVQGVVFRQGMADVFYAFPAMQHETTWFHFSTGCFSALYFMVLPLPPYNFGYKNPILDHAPKRKGFFRRRK